MACCSEVPRFWMLLQNAVLFMGALVLLAIGVEALVDEPRLAVLLGGSVVRGTAVLLTAAAGLALLVSLLGCCGALYHSVCLVGVYGGVSLLLLVLCVTGFCSALFVVGPGAAAAGRSMTASMSQYDVDTEVTQAWDFLQRDFHCCGVADGGDWARNSTINSTVPASCCRLVNGTLAACADTPTDANSYYDAGCLASAQRLVVDHGATFAAAAVVVALFLSLSVGMACCFVKSRREATYERLTI